MANTPQPTHPASPAPAEAKPATPAHPGGMASDPAAALANEIVTNIKGAKERFDRQVESTPALKALMDQAGANLTAEIAQTIRAFVAGEVAKATGGMALQKDK